MKENVYKIDTSTCIIQAIAKKQVKIITNDKDIIENLNHIRLLQDSCIYYGSTYEGRMESAKKILNIYSKIPIIIEETKNIIFFPINSTRKNDCIWISYNNLIKYEEIGSKTRLYFNNDFSYDLDFSYNLIHNQVIKCLFLEKHLNKRKKST